MNAKEASPGTYVMYKKEPFRILKNESISVGTHSHSKTKLTLQSLKKGQTETFACSHHENLEEAEVIKGKGQVMSINNEASEAQIMDLTSYETLTAHFSEKMADDIEENGTVSYIGHESYYMITEARPSKT